MDMVMAIIMKKRIIIIKKKMAIFKTSIIIIAIILIRKMIKNVYHVKLTVKILKQSSKLIIIKLSKLSQTTNKMKN
jgi:hypothetical protein